ncbi:hypothetical protein AALA22_08770 [Anaerovoracaceae bacterium 41-7]
MIIRGTTPTHVFHIPFSIDGVVEAYVTYYQDGRIVIDKRLEEIDVNVFDDKIRVNLTQEDTLSFCCGRKYTDNIVIIQIKLLYENQIVCISEPIREKVADAIKDGRIYPDSSTIKPGDVIVYDGGGVEGY